MASLEDESMEVDVQSPSTPSNVQELSGAMRGFSLISTPKSSRKSIREQIEEGERIQGRILFEKEHISKQPVWSETELLNLVGFLMIFTDGKAWVAHQDLRFWGEAGVYVQHQAKTHHCRSGKACRAKVTKTLSKQFKSPAAAEQHFLSLVQQPEPVPRTQSLVKEFCPDDFLKLAYQGMEHLRACGRSNVIYSLAKALGTMRPGGSDSLLPAKRMPLGLIEYASNFFISPSLQHITCPPDYRSWLQTMYNLFGTKWAKIFNGPMWSHELTLQADPDQNVVKDSTRNPIEALVNVPSLSDRTLRRDIANSGFMAGPEIQLKVLNALAAANPGGWFWIKGDGTDVVKGLWESTRGQWGGDVNLNDGKLEALRYEYDKRMKWIEGLGLNRGDIDAIKEDLKASVEFLQSDINFVHSDLQRANSAYEDKLKSGHTLDQSMFALSWDVEELKALNTEGRRLHSDVLAVCDLCSPDSYLLLNVPKKLENLRKLWSAFQKRITHFRRMPATHIFVLMVSSDVRNQKPYALPVQCLPYEGLKEKDIRGLVSKLIQEMVKLGMNVAGFASNGEFNYLRTKGYTRPLSVLQVRTDVRNKYSRIRINRLVDMLTPKRLENGEIVAVCANVAVKGTVLHEVWAWRKQGISFEDCVDRLRTRTVPSGYPIHNWKAGEEEELPEKLRSILAQFEFSYKISEYDANGVPFKLYLYVPELHPCTSKPFCEQEDNAHLLKRLANHTRSGGPEKLKLERFVEALSDSTSGLTYPALTGSRKQSVVDAERFFGADLANFMRSKNYKYEANFIETIHNWRRANDERGLSELQRCKFNYQLLNMILDDLMPWHKDLYDFSLLEVNRSLKSVLGFSRETLAALITNIEGCEWRRRHNFSDGRRLEHPRASSTDDVECFFSVMRDNIGKNFTTKEVQFGFRKICAEFTKRLDPDLPFYYYTSSHTRYYEGPLLSFNEPSGKKPRKSKRAPRREQPAVFAPRRATMPVRGSLAVRPKFHNLPLELPPPPSAPLHVFEHSYAMN